MNIAGRGGRKSNAPPTPSGGPHPHSKAPPSEGSHKPEPRGFTESSEEAKNKNVSDTIDAETGESLLQSF